ncbi:MAG: acyl-CoA dehydrogenase family protein [Dehalococcoidia bacterium]
MTFRRHYEEDHEAFRDSFRAFLRKEVVPHQDEWRRNGIVSRDVWLAAGSHGYLLPWAEERYGGAGLSDFRFSQIELEELAYIGETGFYLPLHSALVGPYIGKLGTDRQKERFLPRCISGEHVLAVAMTEQGAGSDLAGMKTIAVDHGDHFVLNGAKTFISNGLLADLVVVAAKTDPSRPRRVGLFVLERGMEGFERGTCLNKIGMKSQDTAELFFKDVRVPKENLLGNATDGFRYLMEGLAEERLIAAVTNTGLARYAFDVTLEYIQQRQAFGRPIGSFQNSRFKMAQLSTEIELSQTYVDRCVDALNAGDLSGDHAARIKLYSSEMLGRVVDECLQLHGGYGYIEDYPIARLYCDARITRIFGGSSEIMKEIIAKSIGLIDEPGR